MFRFASSLVALGLVATPALAGFGVSSFHKDSRKGPNYFNAAAALDANPETCWMVNAEESNEGSWIYIDVPTSTVDKLAVYGGWGESEETYRDYSRIKAARVEIFNVSPGGDPELVAETSIKFEDKMGWQMIDLPDQKVGGEFGGGRVKLTVTEIYKGADYPALAIGEIRVHLKEFDAATIALQEPPVALGGHEPDKMLDGSTRTFWAGPEPTATFSVTASGYGMSSLGIQAGSTAYHRPKKVKLTANLAETVHELPDKPGKMQWLLLPALVGYTGGAWGEVKVEILESYPGSSQPGLAITELKMMAGSIEEF